MKGVDWIYLWQSIIRTKSSKQTNPSPFLSTPAIIRWQSSNVHPSSPIAANTLKSSSAVILPSWSASNISNVSRNSEWQVGPTRSISPIMILISSSLGGSAPIRPSRAFSSLRERVGSEKSDQSREGRTLVGVPAAEEEEEEEAEPKEGGWDRESLERWDLEEKRRLGFKDLRSFMFEGNEVWILIWGFGNGSLFWRQVVWRRWRGG